jgi:hypothetical protein
MWLLSLKGVIAIKLTKRITNGATCGDRKTAIHFDETIIQLHENSNPAF